MTTTLITNAAVFRHGEAVADHAVLIREGIIIAVGSTSAIQAHTAAADAHTIDAKGGLLHASFADAHVHTTFAGVELGRLELSECESGEATLTAVAEYAATREDAWILGGGWSMAHFAGGSPTRELLDAIVPDRPVFLINADHHGAWANSRAFEIAGIDASTPDPSDGRFERDVDGTPSGTMHEGAQELFSHVLPPTTMAECTAGLLRGQRVLHEFGVTAWQEAILGEYAGYPEVTRAYTDAISAGKIDADVSGALWVTRELSDPASGVDVDAVIDDFERRRAASAVLGLRTDTAKIMVDGVAETLTAALNDPYLDSCDCAGGSSETRGLAYFGPDELNELVPRLNERGFHVHFHAIGDRAARYALDAVEQVPANLRSRVRNHIAHLQVVDPIDIPRFAALSVTANCQALWAVYEDQMVELTLPVLGQERATWQYPFASLADRGTKLAFGSDWPVSTPNPWHAMHVAVTRKAPGHSEAEAFIPHEALTLAQVLDGYTRGSHELLGTPGAPGVIEVGAPADLALADRNPFAGSVEDIWLTRNVLTLRRGRIVADLRENQI